MVTTRGVRVHAPPQKLYLLKVRKKYAQIAPECISEHLISYNYQNTHVYGHFMGWLITRLTSSLILTDCIIPVCPRIISTQLTSGTRSSAV